VPTEEQLLSTRERLVLIGEWLGSAEEWLLSTVMRLVSTPVATQRHYIRRRCRSRSEETTVIFLFGLEALLRRVSRAQLSADLSFPQ
jgi:hypothetical protein